MFSDSEAFVLGAIIAANKDATHPFHKHVSHIGQILGFYKVENKRLLSHAPLEQVPPEIVWATGEAYDSDKRCLRFRVMAANEVAVRQAELKTRYAEAVRYVEEKRGVFSSALANDLEHGLKWFEKLAVAVGYSRHTPATLYALTGTGEYQVSHHKEPMPEGFTKLLLERLGHLSVVPMEWVMAVPVLASTMSDQAFSRLVPAMDFDTLTIGIDRPDDRQAILQELLGNSLGAKPESLGRTLWGIRILIRLAQEQQHDEQPEDWHLSNDDGPGSFANADSTADVGEASDEITPVEVDGMPEVIQFIRNIQVRFRPDPSSAKARDWRERGEKEISFAKAFTRLAAKAQSLAKDLHMPAVEALVERLANEMNRHALQCTNEAFYRTSSPHDPSVWATKEAEVSNAFCLAYGDLLLRERYLPSPVPTARAKAEILRQTANLRSLVSLALSQLRRDTAKNENCVVAMTLLAPVLEPLVKQAAERYLTHAPSLKVAELLHHLLREAPTRHSPEREEMEVISRVGIALHHGFRNATLHNAAEISGDWESAQFVAFGLLSILNVLDRARSRTT